MANKLINKLLSYQDYNKLIINLINESTNNQQIMNIDTGYLSKTWRCSSTQHNDMTPSCLKSFTLFQ